MLRFRLCQSFYELEKPEMYLDADPVQFARVLAEVQEEICVLGRLDHPYVGPLSSLSLSLSSDGRLQLALAGVWSSCWA